MANPWTKKNPLLSLFLSNANAAAGRARGMWAQQVRRNQATAAKQAASGWTGLWTGATAAKRNRRK